MGGERIPSKKVALGERRLGPAPRLQVAIALRVRAPFQETSLAVYIVALNDIQLSQKHHRPRRCPGLSGIAIKVEPALEISACGRPISGVKRGAAMITRHEGDHG